MVTVEQSSCGSRGGFGGISSKIRSFDKDFSLDIPICQFGTPLTSQNHIWEPPPQSGSGSATAKCPTRLVSESCITVTGGFGPPTTLHLEPDLVPRSWTLVNTEHVFPDRPRQCASNNLSITLALVSVLMTTESYISSWSVGTHFSSVDVKSSRLHQKRNVAHGALWHRRPGQPFPRSWSQLSSSVAGNTQVDTPVRGDGNEVWGDWESCRHRPVDSDYFHRNPRALPASHSCIVQGTSAGQSPYRNLESLGNITLKHIQQISHHRSKII